MFASKSLLAKGGAPIEFVDASANGGNEVAWSTANVSVTADQTIIFWSAGVSVITDFTDNVGGDVGFETTASYTSLYANNDIGPIGDGGNDFLFDAVQVIQATSSGVVYVTSTGNRGCGGGLVVVSDGGNANVDVSTSSGDDVSHTGISSEDILVYIQTTQFPGTGGGGGTALTVPSGFTSAGANKNWTTGRGGGADDWYNISTYQESPSSSVTVTVPNDNALTGFDYSGGVLVRVFR